MRHSTLVRGIVLAAALFVVSACTERIAAADVRFRAGHTPFDGPLADREGRLRIPADATDAEIDRMDYFVAGVVGDAPR